MNLSISQAFNCKNILALKDFNTYLFTYEIHMKPNRVEKWAINIARVWLNRLAMKEFNELRDTKLEDLTVKLQHCKTEVYAVLHVALDRKAKYDSANDMFRAVGEAALEFDKIKTPTEEAAYLGDKVNEVHTG